MFKFNLEHQTRHIFEIKSFFQKGIKSFHLDQNKTCAMGFQKVLSSQSKPTKNESIKEAQVRAVKVRLGLVSTS